MRNLVCHESMTAFGKGFHASSRYIYSFTLRPTDTAKTAISNKPAFRHEMGFFDPKLPL